MITMLRDLLWFLRTWFRTLWIHLRHYIAPRYYRRIERENRLRARDE